MLSTNSESFQDSNCACVCVHKFIKEISEEIYFDEDDDDKQYEHCMWTESDQNQNHQQQQLEHTNETYKNQKLHWTLKESAISSFFLSDKNVTGSTMLRVHSDDEREREWESELRINWNGHFCVWPFCFCRGWIESMDDFWMVCGVQCWCFNARIRAFNALQFLVISPNWLLAKLQ